MHTSHPAPAGKPLADKRILITRPREQAQAFIELLAAQGAVPVVFPTITIVPPRDWGGLDAALAKISYYDAVIFTSVNGVKFFFQRMKEKGIASAFSTALRICAIGPGTAASLQAQGCRVDLVPELYQAEFLVEALEREGISGRRFLLPRAAEARDVLPEEIVRRGGSIDVVTAYRTQGASAKGEELRVLLQRREIDVISFTSSSTVRAFVELIGGPASAAEDLLQGAIIACIGPITAQTVVGLGMRPQIVAEKYTVEGLTEAIVCFYRGPTAGPSDGEPAAVSAKEKAVPGHRD